MKVLLLGRKSYAVEMLEWTIQQPGVEVAGVVADARERELRDAARQFQVPVMSLEEAERGFAGQEPLADLVVSYLFPRRIREPLISAPSLGCINFHPAILPDWKGAAGYNVAILHKLPRWGATAHYVDESFDTGPIIKTFTFDFDYRVETAWSLEKKTQALQCDLYKSIILDVREKGRLEARVQGEEGTYISKRDMEEMKRVDPNLDDIDLKIRAFWFPPYTGAFIELKGEKYTLVNQEILQELDF